MSLRADADPAPRRVRGEASANPAAGDDLADHARDDLNLWERVSFVVVHGVMALLVRIIGPGGVFAFGKAFGTLEWLINPKRRRRFAEALREIMPRELPPERLRKESLAHVQFSRCNKLFVLLFDAIPRRRLESLVEFENRHIVDDAVARGRGVYIAMSHHGPYQIGGLFMSLLGYRMAGVRDRNEGALTRYVQNRFRRKYPEFQRMKMFYSDAYPRVIYRCLQERYVLGSAIDVSRLRHPNLRTQTATVFGRPREFLSGPLHVALRSHATLIQSFVLPLPGFRYRILFRGPLVDPDGEKQATISGLDGRKADIPSLDESEKHLGDAVRAYARNLEAYVAEHPCHLTRT